DSRAVEAGDIFVAREGGRVNGLAFVPQAIAQGAVAIIARRGALASAPVPVIEVDDVPLALAVASAAVYGHPTFGLDVIGITGTNGKTTTALLTRALVNGAGGRCGTIGTLGAEFEGAAQPSAFTSPEADELARAARAMRDRGATHLAMEVSSIALAQKRADAVRFHVAAFTNLTQDHLDFHGSMDAYAAAKARLFYELSPTAAAINVRDPFGRELSQNLPPGLRLVRFSSAADLGPAEVVPTRFHEGSRGIELAASTPMGPVEVQSGLIGSHNLENLLTAIAIGVAMTIDAATIGRALSTDVQVPGRLERCEDPARDDIVVLVDYAHTPDALARALVSVRAVATQRVICVFGCGGDRDPGKRPLMGEAAGRNADWVIVTNDNPRSERPEAIAEAIVFGLAATGTPFEIELDRRAAIDRAVSAARPGDLVLIAGKGHETYQITAGVTAPFDDREEARAALSRRRGEGSAL
ncbi:MAG: UDP-N-acetylmuramoyl-L-alanyl-D-glutamate--2,6-diaminopimelate ligase, partial [Myxococcales bacterium]|nr:UDP-N-acetylmuramoyl-L-alanyl-D-glutamate--2,6-diaminopimelate ligase [Myxococcales bacterium]